MSLWSRRAQIVKYLSERKMFRTESVEGNETRILFRINFLVSLSDFSGSSAKDIKRARNEWYA
jgi:hypothetical protein